MKKIVVGGVEYSYEYQYFPEGLIGWNVYDIPGSGKMTGVSVSEETMYRDIKEGVKAIRKLVEEGKMPK